jgi:hypothetical protein
MFFCHRRYVETENVNPGTLVAARRKGDEARAWSCGRAGQKPTVN